LLVDSLYPQVTEASSSRPVLSVSLPELIFLGEINSEVKLKPSSICILFGSIPNIPSPKKIWDVQNHW